MQELLARDEKKDDGNTSFEAHTKKLHGKIREAAKAAAAAKPAGAVKKFRLTVKTAPRKLPDLLTLDATQCCAPPNCRLAESAGKLSFRSWRTNECEALGERSRSYSLHGKRKALEQLRQAALTQYTDMIDTTCEVEGALLAC